MNTTNNELDKPTGREPVHAHEDLDAGVDAMLMTLGPTLMNGWSFEEKDLAKPLLRSALEGALVRMGLDDLQERHDDAAAYVEKTLDNVNGLSVIWQNAEVSELLVDIRLLLDGKPLAGQADQ